MDLRCSKDIRVDKKNYFIFLYTIENGANTLENYLW